MQEKDLISRQRTEANKPEVMPLQRTEATKPTFTRATPMPDKEVMPLLTNKQQDACVATDDQLLSYLAEIDDAVAAKIREERPDRFIEIAKGILYGQNIAKKQRDTNQLWHDKKCGACKVLMDSFVKRINKLEAKEREWKDKNKILEKRVKHLKEDLVLNTAYIESLEAKEREGK